MGRIRRADRAVPCRFRQCRTFSNSVTYASVITDVFVHKMFQMQLVQNDHWIEQVAEVVAGPAGVGPAVWAGAVRAGVNIDHE